MTRFLTRAAAGLVALQFIVGAFDPISSIVLPAFVAFGALAWAFVKGLDLWRLELASEGPVAAVTGFFKTADDDQTDAILAGFGNSLALAALAVAAAVGMAKLEFSDYATGAFAVLAILLSGDAVRRGGEARLIAWIVIALMIVAAVVVGLLFFWPGAGP